MQPMEGLEKVQKGITSYASEKQILIKRVAIVGGGGLLTAVGLGIALPVITAGLHGLVALSAFGGLSGLIYVASKYVPLLGQKVENDALERQKAEARKNPIPQLQNSYIAKFNRLKISKNALANFATGMAEQKRRMIEKQAREDPDHDLTFARAQLALDESSYEMNIGIHAETEIAVENFKKHIDRLRFQDDLNKSRKSSLDALEGAKDSDPVQQIITEESVRAVEKEADRLFASMQLDTIIAKAKQLRSDSAKNPGLGKIVDAEFTPKN